MAAPLKSGVAETREEGDWVEYVDSLGRSRRCLREDLDKMKERDIMAATSSHPQQRRYVLSRVSATEVVAILYASTCDLLRFHHL